MSKQAKIVARGIDTLVVNGYYTDEQGNPVKQDLEEGLQGTLRHLKEGAIAESGEIPTQWTFAGQTLHMQPNGGNHGQFPYLLKCPLLTLAVSHGKWNGIAQVRLSSEYLWGCQGLNAALVEVNTLLYEFFQADIYLQLSDTDLCVDMAGWDELGNMGVRTDFVSRSRKRVPHYEADWTCETASEYSYGLLPSGFDFSPRGPMSCTIYDKTREIKKSGKVWMEDVWRANGWDEDEDVMVWRIEFKFSREALHELKDGEVFHGIESAYDFVDRLEVLWAYAAGQVGGGPDGMCLMAGYAVWFQPTMIAIVRAGLRIPIGSIVQQAFTVKCEVPAQFGKIIRKRKEQRNIDKAVESMFGYATSMAAWEGDELSELDTDISTFLVSVCRAVFNIPKAVKEGFCSRSTT